MVEFLRGRPGAEGALERASQRSRVVHLTPHVLFELHRGAEGRPERARETRRIERLGELFSLLPFDRNAARLAARMDHALRAEGITIPLLDVLIAASALACGDGEIITRDTEHFGRLRKFGLVVTRPEDIGRGG